MPLVALPWGSPSMRRVRCSAAARLAARLTAVVVLPTPPFWFAIAMTLATCYRVCWRDGGVSAEYTRACRQRLATDVSRGTSAGRDEANVPRETSRGGRRTAGRRRRRLLRARHEPPPRGHVDGDRLLAGVDGGGHRSAPHGLHLHRRIWNRR